MRLALKGNQSTLHDDVKLFIASELKKAGSDKMFDYAKLNDKGHGPIENRKA